MSSEIEKTQQEISQLQFKLAKAPKAGSDADADAAGGSDKSKQAAVTVGNEAWQILRGLVALSIVLTLGAIAGWIAVTATFVVKGTNTRCTTMDDEL